MDARSKAREAAARRAGGGGGRTKAIGPKGDFAFFGDDGSGFKVSPKAVLIFALFFIGSVVVLHIFGKVKSAAIGE